MSLLVFVNPNSRRNRRDFGSADRLAKILGDHGRVVVTPTLGRLAEEATRAANEHPSIIGIHGGDGTLHRTLSALVNAYGSRPLPPIAILTGGTMNAVASSLGLRSKPEAFLAKLIAATRAGAAPTTIRRRCLRVGQEYGFIFGNGLLTNFLEEYYASGSYGAFRALVVVLRILLSLVGNKWYALRIFRRFRGRILIDGTALPYTRLTGLGAATVSEVGLRLKLHHRADDDPDRMGGLAIHSSPLALLLDVLDVRLGRGLSPKRATSFVASRIDIVPAAGGAAYTLDGDMYRSRGPIVVEVGPALEIVRPTV
jgi:diacylglycerol kinase (ATP)